MAEEELAKAHLLLQQVIAKEEEIVLWEYGEYQKTCSKYIQEKLRETTIRRLDMYSSERRHYEDLIAYWSAKRLSAV